VPDDHSSAPSNLHANCGTAPAYLYDNRTDQAIQTRTISLTSRLVADPQAGRAQVSARWSDYWKHCASTSEARVLVGVDTLPIPQPP